MKKYSVVIIGAGPVGLLLAHILGRRGVETLVLESAASLPDEPRAVGLDPESLRTFQSLDLLDVLADDILFGVTGDYRNAAGELLFALDDDLPGPLGFPGLSSFSQPALVRTLVTELKRYPRVSLRYEHELLSLEQNAEWVTARVSKGSSDPMEIRCDFLVGCDGGRSTVRSELGIDMQGDSNPQPWLVIDTKEAEYDGLKRYRFFCDPRRPGMFLQTPHNNRRWEWMLMPGEDRVDILRDENIHDLISPYVDVSKVDVYRRRVYDFHAIIAKKFQLGRVFLAGDAAHMTPPFAGQGLNSGIRDVSNLGWKLAAVFNDGAPLALLDSYEPERRQHAKELIDIALTLGQQIQPIDPEAAAARDAAFAEMHKDPAASEAFIDSIFNALLNRHFLEGSAVGIGQEYLAGRMLSQPLVHNGSDHPVRLDNYLGEGYAIVGFNCDPQVELGEGLSAKWLERGVPLLALGEDDSGMALTLEANSHLAELFGAGEQSMVLLRPDRFCMAAFNRDNAGTKLAKAEKLMGYGG